MSLPTRLVTALAALVVVGTTLTAPGAVAAHPGHEKPTAIFDMYYNAKVQPKRIYLTANSGPWLKGLKWEGWGSAKAVGHGKYISDCASCVGPPRREVTVTYSRRVECHGRGEGYFAYRRGVARLSEPDEGDTDLTFPLPAGCP